MPTWRHAPDPATLAILAAVGRAVTRRRRAARLTQRELAEAIGVAPSTISRLEAGSMACSLPLVARVAIHLGGLELGRRGDLGGAAPDDLARPAWRAR